MLNAVVKNSNAESWIHNVILKKDVAMVIYLLDNGADPNLREIAVSSFKNYSLQLQVVFLLHTYLYVDG